MDFIQVSLDFLLDVLPGNEQILAMERILLNPTVLESCRGWFCRLRLFPRSDAINHHSFLEGRDLISMPTSVERGEVIIVIVPETPYVQLIMLRLR